MSMWDQILPLTATGTTHELHGGASEGEARKEP